MISDLAYDVLMEGCYKPPKHEALTKYANTPEYVRRLSHFMELKKTTDKFKEIKKVGFCNGVFDLTHFGHIQGFKKMKEHCRYLIVGINSDKSASRLNKKFVERPIVPQEERKAILESTRDVNEVIIFDEDTPYELIKKIKPDILFKDESYDREGHPVGKDLVKEVIFIPKTKHSTTKLIKKIRGDTWSKKTI